jgi:RNA polymerase primary sigma factor
MLPTYLRDIGRFPMLDADREAALASALHDAKEESVTLARRLGDRLFHRILEDPSRKLKDLRKWTAREAEEFCDRVVRFERRQPGSISPGILREVQHCRAQLHETRQALTKANLRLAVYVAKRCRSSVMNLTDLIQEGNLGLMKAVDMFDHRIGTRFSTYAYWWIKQSIIRAIADKERLIRVPANQHETRRRIDREQRLLRRSLDRDPTDDELAEALHLHRRKITQARSIVPDAQSLDQLVVENSRDNLVEKLEDRESVKGDEYVERTEILRAIRRALKERLTPREARIVELRYGLGQHTSHTLVEIGRLTNLSRERVRQIEGNAMQKLRGCDALAEILGSLGGA